jgi:hypothetical protein
MENIRVGPKKPTNMGKINTARDVGGFGPCEDSKPHCPAKTPDFGPGGPEVHGLPLFSKAANASED